MVLIRDDDRKMTDDAILEALQQTIRRQDGWDGYLDDDGAGRAEMLLQRAREALALTRLSDLIGPGLPLAACPMCSKYPGQIVGWNAEQIDVTASWDLHRKAIRGLILSITLDCGHELRGVPLGRWVQAATAMREDTAGYWRGQTEQVEKERAGQAEQDAARIERLTEKLRKARKRNRKLRKALDGGGE